LFTGIIEDLGAIASIKRADQGAILAVRTKLPLSRITLGESIAVNGCCLTVTRKGSGTFSADVSAESLRRTVLGELKPGDRVNLERCLTLGKLLGGHLVSGHVDGVGRVVAIEPEGDSKLYTFEVGAPLARYLIEKGSVAIDGISLTVFNIREASVARGRRNGRAIATRSATFKVALIPHTLAVTTLGFKRPGDPVNVENDMLVKYVERVASPYLTGGAGRQASKSHARAKAASVAAGVRGMAGEAS
jgi:riboflavin synthase